MRYVNKKIDGLIVISSYLENYYSNKVNNIAKIPPLIDYSDKNKYVEKIKVDENVNIVTFAKGYRNKENINNLLIAYTNLEIKKIKIIVIGVEKNVFCKLYSKSGNIINISNSNIIFRGRIDNRISKEIVSNSEFLIFFRENTIVTKAGFPSKLVESLSVGTPVITNDTSDIKKYIKNNINGFIIENTIEDIECLLNRISRMDINEIKNMKKILLI